MACLCFCLSFILWSADSQRRWLADRKGTKETERVPNVLMIFGGDETTGRLDFCVVVLFGGSLLQTPPAPSSFCVAVQMPGMGGLVGGVV